MNRKVEESCKRLLDSGASAVALYDLANACRDKAKKERPTLTWLGLESLFRSLDTSIDDRAVSAAETDRMTHQLKPLLQALGKESLDPAAIEGHVAALRALL